MREAVVAVEVHSGVCVVAAEPLATPRVVVVFSLQDVVSRLEEGLLDVKDSVDIKNWNYVEGHVLE